ncbi:MAG TPA: HEAT repeat domain-containing protein [Planctomycetota bacterium]|nr:HEAT repeat domain-containing protein [Planctomycetota bacterium]
MHCLRLCVIAGALWCALDATPPQTAAIEWREDFEAAEKEAARTGKPIFVAFVMDDEPANDEIVAKHFVDEKIVALSREYVCVVANVGAHGEVDAQDAAGAAVKRCSKFGACSCAGHQRAERVAREAFMDSPRVCAPQFLFLRPDGKTILLRSVWMLTVEDLARKMRSALELLDPSKASDETAARRKQIDGWLADAASNNSRTRDLALQQLALCDDPRIVEFLAKQTAENVDEAKRLEAIAALGQRGASDGTVLPVLHKLLGAGSVRVKTRTADALRAIGAPESGPRLAAAIRKESKDSVKGALLRALAVCDPITPAHRNVLTSAAKAGGQTERVAALRALADVKPDAEIAKVFVACASDASNGVRAGAYYGIAKNGLKEALPTLEKRRGLEKANDLKALYEAAVASATEGGWNGADLDGLLAPFLRQVN